MALEQPHLIGDRNWEIYLAWKVRGEKQKDIARRFNLSNTRIAQIVQHTEAELRNDHPMYSYRRARKKTL